MENNKKSETRYVLIGFQPFSENETGMGRVISTHKNKELLEEAWNSYRGRMALDWQKSKNLKYGQTVVNRGNGWESY